MSSFELLTDEERRRVSAYEDREDFVNRFVEWAGLKTDASPYSLTAAGLMALSMAAGDVVVMPDFFSANPQHMNLYVMLVGPSTTMRKTTVLNLVRDLLPLNQTTRQPYVSVVDDASPQALGRRLADAGKQMAPLLLTVDEASGLFRNIHKSNSYLTGMSETLLKAYDHSPVEIARQTGDLSVPGGAFLGVWAASTPDALADALTPGDIESGLLPRFLMLWLDPEDTSRGKRISLRDRHNNDERFGAMMEDLRATLLDIAGNRARGIPDGNDPEREPFARHNLGVSDDAIDRLDALLAAMDRPEDDTGLAAIKGRAFVHVFKLAGLFALSRAGRDATVELSDVERALWLLEATLGDTMRLHGAVTQTEMGRLVDAALAQLDGTKGRTVRRSAVARTLRLDARQLGDLEATLLAQDLIRLEKVPGKPRDRYWRPAEAVEDDFEAQVRTLTDILNREGRLTATEQYAALPGVDKERLEVVRRAVCERGYGRTEKVQGERGAPVTYLVAVTSAEAAS